MSDTQLIKDKLDIVTLIGEYVQLKPAGINHKGLCPFHHEKSPSFMVNRERQSWHCFGCQKGGDAFSFVQEIEGLEFREALQFLAARAGVTLTDTRQSGAETSQKSRLKDIMAEAARFYHNVLTRLPAAEPAQAYLQGRGVTAVTIDEWQTGFIPDQWDLLTKYLLQKGYAIDDMVATGLTIQRDSADRASGRGFYDRFRGRVMFPIWDVHDTVVGFTGRVLVETEHSGGKYVNTPQSPLYDKSRVVFGLNKAKAAIRSEGAMIMVEGQMDVIACHQAGMKNVVATSGTALTEFQIQLLKRYANTLLIAFDADAAGQQAAERGIDLARAAGLAVKVIRLAEGAGKDPDEALKKNPEAWWAAVKGASDIMEWYLARALSKDLADPREQQTAVNYVLGKIAVIPYAVERDHWLRELSGRIGVDIAVLRENLKEVRKATQAATPSARPVAPTAPAPTPKAAPNRFTQVLERLLVLWCRYPQLATKFFAQSAQSVSREKSVIASLALSTPALAPLYEAMQTQYTATSGVSIAALRESFYANAAGGENIIDVLLMKGELDFFGLGEAEVNTEAANIIRYLVEDWSRTRRVEVAFALAQAEKAGDTAKVQALLQELQII